MGIDITDGYSYGLGGVKIRVLNENCFLAVPSVRFGKLIIGIGIKGTFAGNIFRSVIGISCCDFQTGKI